MSIQLYDIDCPACGKTCWVNNGDVEDLTAPDVEAVRCPWCQEKFPVPGLDGLDEADIDDLYSVDGHKTAAAAAG